MSYRKLKRRYDRLGLSGQREFFNLKTCHLNEKMELIQRMGQIAIDKALTSNNERLDASNHKYALLKEQAAEFPTRGDLKVLEDKVSGLNKLVYIGMGLVFALQFVAFLIIKFL